MMTHIRQLCHIHTLQTVWHPLLAIYNKTPLRHLQPNAIRSPTGLEENDNRMACFKSSRIVYVEDSDEPTPPPTRKNKKKEKNLQKQIYLLKISSTSDGGSVARKAVPVVDGSDAAWPEEDIKCPAYRVAWYVGYEMMLRRFSHGHDPLQSWDLRRCPDAEVSIEVRNFSTTEDRDAAIEIQTAVLKSMPRFNNRCKRDNHADCSRSIAIPADKISCTESSSCQLCGMVVAAYRCTRCRGPTCSRDKSWSTSFRHDDWFIKRLKGQPWCSDGRLCALCECPSDSSDRDDDPPTYAEAVSKKKKTLKKARSSR